MNDEEKNKYVPLRVAKDYFSVTDQTLRTWIKSGCPCLKLKTHHRVKIAEVEAWLRSRDV